MATKIFHHTEPSAAFTSPGCYPIAYEQSGCVLCPKCATETRHKQRDPECAPYMTRDERAPVEAFVHWEGEPLVCEGCNAEIESAYGPVEDAS